MFKDFREFENGALIDADLCANPTLTIVALALRLAAHLGEDNHA